MKWDTFLWWAFFVPPPFHSLQLCALLSARFAVFDSQSLLLSSPSLYSSPVQCDSLGGDQLLTQGERSEHMYLQYSCAQLLAVTLAQLTSDLVSCLRLRQIGVGLPRKQYQRKRKQCKPGQLRVLCFNLQSCHQKATDIHELIIDNDADVLMLTETWLYPQGDEAYIAAMTPAGCDFHSFPHPGLRGGGIAFITRTNLSKFVTFRPLDCTLFESVEMSLGISRASVSFVCLYRPSPSKTSKLLNSTFLHEFPELLSSYADCRCYVSFLGDFNFHFDDCSDPQVNWLKTMLSDFGLSQLVSVPTYHCGHTLDWVSVHSEESLVYLERIQDYASLSDHYVVCCLAVTMPSPPTRLVTSRNIRAVSSSGFQADVKALVDSMGEQRSNMDLEDLVDVCNDGL